MVQSIDSVQTACTHRFFELQKSYDSLVTSASSQIEGETGQTRLGI